jgi:hypothetical protein
VSSLGNFLKLSTQHRKSATDDFWYLRNSFTSARAHESFIKLVQQCDPKRDVARIPPLDTQNENLIGHHLDVFTATPWQETDLHDAFDGCFISACATPSGVEESHVGTIERILHKFIVEVWLDNAPSAFLSLESQPSKLSNLRLVHAIVQLAQTIYYDLLRGASQVGAPGFIILDPHSRLPG